MMSNDPLAWIDDELLTLEQQHLRRELAVRDGPQRPATIRLDGNPIVNFGSNDYLGFAAESLVAAVQDSIQQVGWGSGASPLITGRAAVHAELERRLAEFEATEAALLFPSGFAANVGTIPALVGKQDVIFSDAKNHASIIDGCRLSGARIEVYPHRDVDYLKTVIQDAGDFRRRLIITDGLFSMDGDLAPLVELAELAEQFDAVLMVDEAHATGVFGTNGRGVCEHLGTEGGVHVRVGTLSKALGSIGGFVVGQQRLIDWLANRARSYVFSTALPEATAAAGIEALRLVQCEPHRRVALLDRAASLRGQLKQQGWSTADSASQIIPVIVRDPARTMDMASALRERGLLVPGIRPPSVSAGESLLRISLSCAHTEEMIDRLLQAMEELKDRLVPRLLPGNEKFTLSVSRGRTIP